MTSNGKLFTFDEIANHNHKKDCWLLISGKVYDVTPFLDDHPGGEDLLVLATAKDATYEFEDVGHSDGAKEDMKKYYIGDLDGPAVLLEDQRINSAPKAATSTATHSPGVASKIIQFMLPLLILGLAFVVRHYTKKD